MMTFSREGLVSWFKVTVAVGLVVISAGCGTTAPPGPGPAGGTPPVSIPLRTGEGLRITFSDVTPPLERFEGTIRQDGKITLMQYQEFVAAGKTPAELEKEIHDRYVTNFFQRLTATVQPMDRYYFVTGEVNRQSQLLYTDNITLLGAIAAAGGPTVFAKLTKIQIIRTNGKTEKANYNTIKKHPETDPRIYPGDTIIVPRRTL